MKKLVLLATIAIALISCNKVGKNEFLISGTATGIEDGKMIVLQKQDPTTGILIGLDSAKVKSGKFELKGKVTEPAFNVLQIGKKGSNVGFILESGEIKVVVNKDSINKTTISGTYNNDEFASFKKNSEKIQKTLQKKQMEFQTKNMAAMNEAQKVKDTAVINRLMREYTEIQKESTTFFTEYASTHPKSFLSVLVVDGMFSMPKPEIEKIKKIYEGLDTELKNTKPGKSIKDKLAKINAPVPTAPPAPTVSAPAAPEQK